MVYSKEETIKDMERCVKEFERKGLKMLADMKRKEIENYKKTGKSC